MKVLVIGKPIYNIIMPMNTFIKEGSSVNINDIIEIGGGSSIYIACLLSKWGVDVTYAGVVGNDQWGVRIKKDLETYGVNTKYLEINYEKPTSMSYDIINTSNGSSTSVIKNAAENMITKFKYDFDPDFIIYDGTDTDGSYAALNNLSKVPTIFLANKIDENSVRFSKKSHFVCANMEFVSHITKMDFDFKKNDVLVNIYQKVKDTNIAKFTIMLGNKGVLYADANQVKLLPSLNIEKKDTSNYESAFTAALSYGIINNLEEDSRVKIANAASNIAMSKVGTLHTIPELDEVLKMSGVSININNEVKEEPPIDTLDQENVADGNI